MRTGLTAYQGMDSHVMQETDEVVTRAGVFIVPTIFTIAVPFTLIVYVDRKKYGPVGE